MRRIGAYNELQLGDVLEATEDLRYWIGGPIYCLKREQVVVTNIYENGCRIVHYDAGINFFMGDRDRRKFRLVRHDVPLDRKAAKIAPEPPFRRGTWPRYEGGAILQGIIPFFAWIQRKSRAPKRVPLISKRVKIRLQPLQGLQSKTHTVSCVSKPKPKTTKRHMATKKTSKTAAPKSTKPTASRQSLANLFDDTDQSEASNLLPAGEHEVRLNSLIIKDDPKDPNVQKKGAGAFAEYESIDGEFEGKKVRQMYKLTDAAGNKAQGMAFLKRDLALLGYDEINGKQLKKVCKDLTESQPMVIINVKENGQYVNAYLQGLSEDVATGDDDDDDDSDDTAAIEVGSTVTFDDDGETKTGEVIKIKDGVATVKDEDGEKYKADLDDLTLASGDENDDADADADDDDDDDDSEAAVELEVGDEVSGTSQKGKDVSGTITKITDEYVLVQDDDGKKHKCDVTELEKTSTDDDDADADDDDDDDDDKPVIEKGSRVKWTNEEEDEVEGEVVKISNGQATVKDDDGDRFKIDVEDLELAD